MVPKTKTDEISPKREIFVALTSIYLTALVLNAKFDWVDDCLLAYMFSLTASSSCAVLYIWWWRKTKHATEVYKWVTILFVGMVISRLMTTFARYLYIIDTTNLGYQAFLDHWTWALRSVPETLVLFFMIALVIGRLTK